MKKDNSHGDDSIQAPREDVLGDAQTLASIRTVLRRRGVAEHELDDLCREVVAEAWAAKNLPEGSFEEARKYINGRRSSRPA